VLGLAVLAAGAPGAAAKQPACGDGATLFVAQGLRIFAIPFGLPGRR
jgi:hypothetical protein